MSEISVQDPVGSRPSKFAAALNIQPGEGRPTFLLFAQAFFLGIALITSYSASNAIFLESFSSKQIPYVYIVAALFIIAAGIGFSQLQKFISFSLLLILTLGFLLVTVAGLWLGLSLSSSTWMAFFPMVWMRISWVLANLVLWALAGRLFNVRQGKRLFTLITAGAVLGVILFGLFTTPLIGLIGTINMLLVTTFAITAAIAILIYTLRRYSNELKAKSSAAAGPSGASRGSLTSLFRNRFVLLIFIYTAFSTLSTYVLDFAFISQAGRRFSEIDALGNFFGTYLGVTTFVTLLFLTLVAGRLLNRYGLRGGILADPVAVALGALAVVIASIFSLPAGVIFWLVVLTKFFDDIMVVAMTNNSVRILYQPLNADERVTAQVAVESIIGPAAIGLSGVLLLIFFSLGSFDPMYVIYLLLVLLVIWMAAGALLSRRYIFALSNALKNRVINPDSEVNFNDSSSLAVLENALESSQPGEVLFALEVLEETRQATVRPALAKLLRHPTPEVRREALRKIKKLNLVEALPAIRELLGSEGDPPVISQALQTCCALDGTAGPALAAGYLGHSDPTIQRGAILSLMGGANPEGVLAAGQQLTSLETSPDSAKRLLAAEIIGELKFASLNDRLIELLHDANSHVRKAALKAAGKMRNPQLLPAVVENLENRVARQAAAWALASWGGQAIPAVREAYHNPHTNSGARALLVKAAGKASNPQAAEFLVSLIQSPDGRLRSLAVQGLFQQKYQAAELEKPEFQANIRAEVESAAQLLAIGRSLEAEQEPGPRRLVNALQDEIEAIQNRVFCLVACLHDPKLVAQIQKNFKVPSEERKAYALEALDLLLTQAEKELALPLLQPQSDAKRLAQLERIFPQEKRSPSDAVSRLLEDPGLPITGWTRACAVAAQPPDHPSTTQDFDSQERQAMLLMVEKVLILKSVPLFAETSENVLADLAQVLDEETVDAGQTILNQGDLGDSLYIIVDGQVRVHQGDKTITTLADRDVFGEMALLDPEPRSASITTLTKTNLLKLDQEAFNELMDEQMEIVHGILRVITRRLRSMNLQEVG